MLYRVSYTLRDQSTPDAHCFGVNTLARSPDGTVYTGGRDSSIRSWNVSRDTILHKHLYQGHTDWVNDITLVLPDKRMYICTLDEHPFSSIILSSWFFQWLHLSPWIGFWGAVEVVFVPVPHTSWFFVLWWKVQSGQGFLVASSSLMLFAKPYLRLWFCFQLPPQRSVRTQWSSSLLFVSSLLTFFSVVLFQRWIGQIVVNRDSRNHGDLFMAHGLCKSSVVVFGVNSSRFNGPGRPACILGHRGMCD